MICGAVVISIFRYSWLDPAALLSFFALLALITANARHHREKGHAAYTMQWAQGEQYAELEYHARAAQKGAPHNTSSEGEVKA